MKEPQEWSDRILQRAVDLDEGRPGDDISVVVAAVLEADDDNVRRLSVRVPI